MSLFHTERLELCAVIIREFNFHNLGVMIQAWNLSIWEEEVGGPKTECHCWLHSGCEASLGYMTACPRRKGCFPVEHSQRALQQQQCLFLCTVAFGHTREPAGGCSPGCYQLMVTAPTPTGEHGLNSVSSHFKGVSWDWKDSVGKCLLPSQRTQVQFPVQTW